jgi:hypothetical protein
VTRAVSDGRYAVDVALSRPQLGVARERFVFVLQCGDRRRTVALHDGFVTEEFIALTRERSRTDAEEQQLTVMKREMAARVMAAPADAVYALDPQGGGGGARGSRLAARG